MNTLSTIEILNPYFDPLIDALCADPQLVFQLVKKELTPLAIARANSPEISFASWNAEFLWQAKAKHFIETYTEIISKHHLLALQEVSVQGISLLSKTTGYNYVASQPNSRGQAVGFLVHPRFTINSIVEYSELVAVYGISNLRPALRIDLIDKQSNKALSVITVHLKSMLGGISHTSIIRHEQLNRLMIALSDSTSPTLIVGDFNCFLDKSDDISPLLNNRFVLANKTNHTSTQICGGRLDGLFYRNLSTNFKPRHYKLHDFWRNGLIGRSLSDHGLLTWTLAH